MSDIPYARPMPIAVRGYAPPIDRNLRTGRKRKRQSIGPSDWRLVLHTDTTVDAAQRLQFGCFRVFNGGEFKQAGLFYDSLALSVEELRAIQEYADTHGFVAVRVDEFVDKVFYYYAYDLSALCVGFNLPFTLSRLAVAHAPARGRMRGGFSFQLSANTERCRLRIKHLNSRAALIGFSRPRKQNTSGSARRRGDATPPHLGYFIDVNTIACALLSGSWSLRSLAGHLQPVSAKHA